MEILARVAHPLEFQLHRTCALFAEHLQEETIPGCNSGRTTTSSRPEAPELAPGKLFTCFEVSVSGCIGFSYASTRGTRASRARVPGMHTEYPGRHSYPGTPGLGTRYAG
eukprot:3049545-Rhodomonas_salina.2